MSSSLIIILILLASACAFFLGKKRALSLRAGLINLERLHSQPNHHGILVALWCVIPSLVIFFTWQCIDDTVLTHFAMKTFAAHHVSLNPTRAELLATELHNVISGKTSSDTAISPALEAAARRYLALQQTANRGLLVAFCSFFLAALGFAAFRLSPDLKARNQVEKVFHLILMLCTALVFLTTLGIIFSALFESIRFFKQVSLFDFLFGLNWSPQTAIRADQIGNPGSFGVVPVITGTLLITTIAMLVAIPIGTMSAVYLSEYAQPRVRKTIKPLLEILAGIPTVVYGFFAILVIAPAVHNVGAILGLSISSESALAVGFVVGIMITPFISSLSDDAINTVPQTLRDGSYALGATQSETIKNVVLPAAAPGIAGAILLALSRAIGETMIVAMAASLAAPLTFNPLRAVTAISTQMVTLLTGVQEFDSTTTLAAFTLGLLLFLSTLALNTIAFYFVRNRRQNLS